MIADRDVQLHGAFVIFEKTTFDKLHLWPIRTTVGTGNRNVVPVKAGRGNDI